MDSNDAEKSGLQKIIWVCRALEICGVIAIFGLAVVGGNGGFASESTGRRLFIGTILFIVTIGGYERSAVKRLRTLDNGGASQAEEMEK